MTPKLKTEHSLEGIARETTSAWMLAAHVVTHMQKDTDRTWCLWGVNRELRGVRMRR